MKVRRVVTGHDRSGKAVFVSDGQVEPVTAELMPGSEFHKLWGGDRTPSTRTTASGGTSRINSARGSRAASAAARL